MRNTTKTSKPAETQTAATEAAAVEQTVIAYKGFDQQLRCRGYQYEVGKTYEHAGKVEACASGFHACEHPLDVFDYYAPAGSRFAEVTLGGEMDRNGSDTKIAAARITINVELSIGDLVRRAWDYVWSRATLEGETATGYHGAASATGYRGAASATGDRGAASATGYQGAASATGDRGAASATGDRGAASATGDRGAASATGYRGAASATGDRGAASATGYQGAASATGDRGAASATGDRGAASATGDRGAASATGYRGAASATGDRGAASATGYQGVASATGYRGVASATGYQGAAEALHPTATAHASGPDGRVRGVAGAALHLDRRDNDGAITHAWAGIVGRDGIESMVWYRLDDGGRPIADQG
ncbi:DUF7666 domain-containing protein [Rhodoplanes serenus]|uniref:DUF7666 domain-containing protein n=1 Tax=Rhodoplanes serenus TaxID=200615 RepID=UPI002545C7AA|nr:hypothetical protein [Rhodoplanes serenus]